MAFKGTRAAQRPATSPRRSRRSAAISTPIPPRADRLLRQGAEGGRCRWRSISSPTSCSTRSSTRTSWSASAPWSCRRSARRTTRRTTSSSTISRRPPIPDQPMGRPVLGTAEIVGVAAARGDRRLYAAATTAPTPWCWPPPATSTTTGWSSWPSGCSTGLPAKAEARTARAAYQGGEHREERDLEQVHLVLGFPGLSLHRSGLSTPPRCCRPLLGGGMSSRLFQEVREKRGLVYSIYSFTSAYQDGGLFGIYAGTGESEVAGADAGAVRRDRPGGRRRRPRTRSPAPAPRSRPAC